MKYFVVLFILFCFLGICSAQSKETYEKFNNNTLKVNDLDISTTIYGEEVKVKVDEYLVTYENLKFAYDSAVLDLATVESRYITDKAKLSELVNITQKRLAEAEKLGIKAKEK